MSGWSKDFFDKNIEEEKRTELDRPKGDGVWNADLFKENLNKSRFGTPKDAGYFDFVSDKQTKAAMKSNPSLAAKAKKYSDTYGIPAERVTERMDDFQAKDLAARINSLPSQQKGFVSRNLNVVHKDIDSIERMAGFWSSLGTRGINQMQGFGYAALEVTGELTGSDGLTKFGKEGRLVNEKEASFAGASQQFTDIGGVGDAGTWISQSAGELIPPIAVVSAAGAGFGALGLLGGPFAPLTVPAMSVLGSTVAGVIMGVGSMQSSVKEKDENISAPASVIASGTLIGAIDSILPGRVGSKLAKSLGFDVVDMVADAAVQKTMAEMAKRVGVESGKGFGIGGVTESIEEVLEEVVSSSITGQKIDVSELANVAVESFFKGGLGGGMMTSVAETISIRSEVNRSKKRAEVVRSINSEQTTMRNEAPEVYAQSQGQAMRENGIDGVNIDSDGIKILNQEIGDSDIFQDVNVEEMLVTGESMNVSPEAFWSLPESVIDTLADNITFNESELSTIEAQAAQDTAYKLGPVVSSEIDAISMGLTSYDEIFSNIYKQRTASNTPAEQANVEAMQMTDFLMVNAKRAGVDPLELFKSIGLQIKEDIPESYVSYKPDQQDYMIDMAKRISGSGGDQNFYGESLIEFIANRGGIIDNEGDLAGMNLEKWHKEKKFRKKAVREHVADDDPSMFGDKKSEEGLDFTPDYVREAAVEAGYLKDGSGIRDLYDAIDAELHGTPQFLINNFDEKAEAEMASIYDLNQYMHMNDIDLDQDTKVIKEQLEAAQIRNREGSDVYNQSDITDTPAFKEWFGDSKVVDENGDPLVVYHGSPVDFELFDVDKMGGGHDVEGAGFYFTSDETEAKGYSDGTTRETSESKTLGKTYEVYLNITNPVPIVGELNVNEIEKMIFIANGVNSLEELGQTFENDMDLFWESPLSNWDENPFSAIQAQVNSIMDFDGTPHEAFQSVWWDVFGGDNAKYVTAMANLGYDGVIIKNDDKHGTESDHYIVFNPSNIKSIHNKGAFDASDPRILYQSVQNSAEGLQSALLNSARGIKQAKGSGDQMLGMLRKTAGIKEDEIAWTGLDEYLKGKKSVTKDEIVTYLEENQIQIEEVTLGGENQVIEEVTVAQSILDEGGELYAIDSSGRVASILNDDGKLLPYVTDNWESYTVKKGSFEKTEQETKYSDYTLEGGENYREVLMTLPAKSEDIIDRADANGNTYRTQKEIDSYKSSHFNQKNILAHVRLNDRVDDQGRKVLFVEEIQSDWHQEGRKQGYKGNYKKTDLEARWREPDIPDGHDPKNYSGYYEVFNKATGELIIRNPGRAKTEKEAVDLALTDWLGAYEQYKVPNAPFKKNWQEMAFRRVMQMASQGGYDVVSWTPGEVQNERFDLSKKLSKIRAEKLSGGTKDGQYVISGYDLDGNSILNDVYPESEIENVVGKDLAQRIVSDAKDNPDGKDYSGLDLKVGGEGMKGFYDKILVKYANKFGKKYSSKVEVSKVDVVGDSKSNESDVALLDDLGVKATGKNKQDVWTLPVTDAMRTSAQKGFELFQENRGSIDFTDMNNIVIRLFKEKNLSTFLHESGHLYLEMLSKLSNSDNAEIGIKNDMDVINKWLGSNPDTAFTREQHEKFATTYEQYLKEGKAPSVGLMDAFARFSSWLTWIYKKFQVPGSDLSPEIREVFDRMLATEEQITEARNTSRMHKVFADAETAGMTKKEYDKYTDSIEVARASQHAELTAQTFRELKRENSKWWKKDSIIEEEKIIKELDSDPVWSARYLIQEGRLPSGEKIADLPKGGLKFSKQAVADMEHSESLKYLPGGNRMYRKDGGLHPDDIANYVGYGSGYGSGSELLHDLMSMPKNENGKFITEKQFAKIESQNRMKEKNGDIMNDGTLQEEALMRIHSERQSRILQREMQQLAKLSGNSRALSNKIMKDAAKRIVQKSNVSKILNHKRYLNAETKAASQAAVAVSEGKMDVAFEAKQQQLLNFHLYRQSREVAEKASKMAAYLKDKQKKVINPKNIHPDFIKQVKALLSPISFGQKMGQKKFDTMSTETLKNWADKQSEKYGASFHIPAELDRALTKTNYKDMTLAELGGLHDTVKSIMSQGRRYSNAQQDQFLSIVHNMKQSILNNAKKVHSDKIEPGLLSGVGRGAKLFVAEHRQMLSLIQELDGGGVGGEVYKNIYQRIKQADDNYIDRGMDASEQLNVILKSYTKKERLGFYFKQYIPSLGQSLSLNARLSFALNMGNAGNVDAIKNEYSDVQIEGILKTLTDKDWNVVESMWEHVNQYKGDLLDLQERTTGVRPSEVEAVPFITPNGREVTGGYYPLMGDPNRSDAARKDQEQRASLQGFLKGGHSKASTKTGAEIERKGFGRDRKVWLDLGVLFRHVDGVIKDIELREAVGDVDRFINNKDFASAVKSAKGAEFHLMMEKWLENIAGNNLQPITSTEKFIQYARTGASVAEMGFSLRTILQQPFGITQSVVLIGEKYTAKGVIEFALGRGEAAKKVMELSKFMRNRAATYNRDVKDASKLVGAKGVHDDIISASFWGIQKLDMAVSIPTWLGSYEKALSEGILGQDAIDYADGIVARSQGSGLPRDLADIQQGAPWKKLLTMFYTFFGAYYNVQTDLVKETNFKNPKQALKYAKNQVWVTLIPSMLIDYYFNGGPDEEDDTVALWMAKSVGGFAGSGLVGIRDWIGGLASGYGYQVSPVGGLFKHASNFGKQAAQGDADVAFSKSLIMTVGYGLQLPAARTVTRATDYLDKEGTDELDTFEGWWRLLVKGAEK